MKKIEKTIILALFFSVAVHGIFFAVTPHIYLSGMNRFLEDTRKIFRIKKVKKEAEEVSLFSAKKNPVTKIKMSKKETPSGYKFMKAMAAEDLSREDLSLQKKKDMLNDRKMKNKNLPELNPKDILRTEEEKAREEIDPPKRSFSGKLSSEKLVETGEEDLSGYDKIQIEEKAGPFSEVSESGFSGITAEIPLAGNMISDMYADEKGDYEDIGKYIDILLSTYTDPDDGDSYFRLIIKVKNGVRLEAMPKEVMFLVDSSKSITGKKLGFIKKGLKQIITDLNEGDRFNLVAFRGDLIKFRASSVEATERMTEEALDFINGLEAEGQTDVEQALYGISAEPIDMYPSYLMLVTDGRPTTGIMDSRRIIQAITKKNDKIRPIFSFAGGSRINKYLLEFISYQNRAWSWFSSTAFDMEKDLVSFYDQIKDPILVDVRYFLVGIDREEVYPRYLSDFYQGKPLEIYGKFKDENAFSMQLLGRAMDGTKEIVFEKSFDTAEIGNHEIAVNWAFRKIYYLISLNTMGIGDPVKLREEIKDLSEKYNIRTPYDIKNGKKSK